MSFSTVSRKMNYNQSGRFSVCVYVCVCAGSMFSKGSQGPPSSSQAFLDFSGVVVPQQQTFVLTHEAPATSSQALQSISRQDGTYIQQPQPLGMNLQQVHTEGHVVSQVGTQNLNNIPQFVSTQPVTIGMIPTLGNIHQVSHQHQYVTLPAAHLSHSSSGGGVGSGVAGTSSSQVAISMQVVVSGIRDVMAVLFEVQQLTGCKVFASPESTTTCTLKVSGSQQQVQDAVHILLGVFGSV